MTKKISITIRPPDLIDDYLVASQALEQVLDVIWALESADATESVVWRLVGARTHSPPFTAEVAAYPVQGGMDVGPIAEQVAHALEDDLERMLSGETPELLPEKSVKHLQSAFRRNTESIAYTHIDLEGRAPVVIEREGAARALTGLRRTGPRTTAEYTSYGTVEGEVLSISKRRGVASLTVRSEESGLEVVCEFHPPDDVAVGTENTWSDVWERERVSIEGEKVCGADGTLLRVRGKHVWKLPGDPVDLQELQDLNILGGKSIEEHLDEIWGDR